MQLNTQLIWSKGRTTVHVESFVGSFARTLQAKIECDKAKTTNKKGCVFGYDDVASVPQRIGY